MCCCCSSKQLGDHTDPMDSWLFSRSKFGGGVCGRVCWSCPSCRFFFFTGAGWGSGLLRARFFGRTISDLFTALSKRICLLRVSSRLQKLSLQQVKTYKCITTITCQTDNKLTLLTQLTFRFPFLPLLHIWSLPCSKCTSLVRRSLHHTRAKASSGPTC